MPLTSKITHWLLATTFAVASVLPVDCFASVAATEGLDVRNVQRISTALLASAVPQADADINRDGRVDILDFQCAVNQATGAASGDQPERNPQIPAQQQPPSQVAAQEHLLLLKVAAQAIVLLPLPMAPAFDAPAAPRAHTPKDALARLGLLAHAPPIA